MPDQSSNILRQLVSDPLSYLTAVMIIVGGGLLKNDKLGPTWVIGALMVGVGATVLMVRLIMSILDSAHQKRYKDLINAQTTTIKNLTSVNKNLSGVNRELSKTSINAHSNIGQPSTDLPGGYIRQSDSDSNGTSTTGV